ncbi:pyruvate/2-oxoglutarate dehydrogenase complex dihydrolipoamide dehydrogenase (E3) component [Flavobacterium sp. 7E]|uniref:dihydrolipoyl dehydrogenase family protein n=1 Tax=Flavobacterium sp. 7E TaxID=2735898 RepID=UPI00156E7069|nr:FAD-dependent oxidoreductase [Flavobacterium sp. 7E]NRS90603.1 pyruvate/2-oxoglutarate dehydrogenase complex dihydrolipoamide dehydrogenase (E3) component [Flavobacterium sp. 7E]
MKKYDLIIIGAGSGGLSVGGFMVKLGFKVLMVSKTEHQIGGDCLNDGCVPSKALIHVANIVDNARKASNFGLQLTQEVDLEKVVKYIYDSQEVIRAHENKPYFEKEGFDIAIGSATFTGKNQVAVAGVNYTAKKIILATGSRPRKLTVPGIEMVKHYDNQSIFKIKEFPKRLLFIGGGPIGIEMAQAFQKLGAKITVVHHGNTILQHDDQDLSKILTKRLEQSGMEFHFNAAITHFESANKGIIKNNEGKITPLEFDAVFVAIGRQLNIENLDLEKAGVVIENNKIKVDDYLQTSNKNVLLCGDVAGKLQFSHAAEQHGRLIINNLISPLKKKISNKHMSWITFTDPELATFGYNEKDLRERNIKYTKLEQTFANDDRAIVDDYQYGQLNLYLSKGNFFQKEKILGGTMLAPKAGELIQELILANTSGMSINAITNKIYPYPAASRINQKAISQHKLKIINKNTKKILQFAFKLFS